jgi:LCP family protein required for cell wall assembly
VTQITGLPIHYAMVIDFEGFTNIIDLIGGIDVNIPLGFVDHFYPIPGKEQDLCSGDPSFSCRYQTVKFLAGEEHLYGERALQYVRSRHAEGEAGSDFSRGKRQQDVVQAVITKLHAPYLFLSNAMIEKSIAVVSRSVTTDIDESSFAALSLRLAPSFLSFSPVHVTVEDALVNPPEELYDGRYVLLPKGSWSDFQTLIASSIK